jgi:FkbM family methyltransferase
MKIIKRHITKLNPVCFDVGAFRGQSVEYLKTVFKKPLIYSFEPLQKNFAILKRNNYTDNKCYNVAVSNFTGETSFYENKISHTSSLLKVNKQSKDSVKISEANSNNDNDLFLSFNKRVKVKTITLDDFYLSNKLSKIDLLKIDVQGAESMVIKGAVNHFLKIQRQ